MKSPSSSPGIVLPGEEQTVKKIWFIHWKYKVCTPFAPNEQSEQYYRKEVTKCQKKIIKK